MAEKFVFRNASISPQNDEFLRRFTGIVCANSGLSVSASQIIDSMLSVIRSTPEVAQMVEHEATSSKQAFLDVRKAVREKKARELARTR